MITLKVERHEDNDGLPGKKITVSDESGTILLLKLGMTEAAMLATALKPGARDVIMDGGRNG